MSIALPRNITGASRKSSTYLRGGARVIWISLKQDGINMRYLAQIARETTARVLPRRAPSWAPARALTEQDMVVESPSPPSYSTTLARTETPLEPSASVNSRHEEKAAERAALAPAAPRPRSDSTKSSARSVEGPVPSPVREIEEAPNPRNIVVNQQPAVPVSSHRETLSGVLAEMARRQKLLEARYRADESSGESLPRTQSRPAEITNLAAPARLEAEDVRLNIGSIVVQIEPSPAPAAVPQPTAHRQPLREPVKRWARSFLDRQGS
jgi:hypothetical protein